MRDRSNEKAFSPFTFPMDSDAAAIGYNPKEFMMNVMKELIQAFSKQSPQEQRKKKSSLESSSSSNTNGGVGGIRSFSLGRVMRNISYEDEAYGLEGISLYEEEKRFMKEKFDIDMDELMTEEEYTSADVYSSGDE